MFHVDRAIFLSRKKSRVHGNVSDHTARNIHLRQAAEIELVQRRLRRENFLPDGLPLFYLWKGELDNETQPP